MFKPSVYQSNIFNEVERGKGHLFISAVAGSGKTTTIVKCLELLPKEKEVVFLAFSNAIVKELQKRVDNSSVKISTLHSFGFHALKTKYGSKIKFNDNKMLSKIEAVCNKIDGMTDKKKYWYFYIVKKVLDLARLNLVFDREGLEELCIQHDILLEEEEFVIVEKVWKRFQKDIFQCDFVDMIYMPAVDDTIRLAKYDYVFVDESQDLSLAQQEIIKKIVKKSGRLICVGDPRQAIYGFAGADFNSYERLSSIYPNTQRLPLSVCYRCDRQIVDLASSIVQEIESHEDADEGIVREGDLLKLRSNDWILCRNVKPLVMLNMHLLKQGIKSKVRGKDIGEGLASMVNKQSTQSLQAMFVKLDASYKRLISQLKSKGINKPEKHNRAVLFRQKQELLEVLSEGIHNTKQLLTRIKEIFSDEIEGILLSTIHKAKGLENDRVFFICPELIPSKYATKPWQIEQEENLKYVAITRAKKELVIVFEDTFNNNLQQEIKCKRISKKTNI